MLFNGAIEKNYIIIVIITVSLGFTKLSVQQFQEGRKMKRSSKKQPS